MCISNVENLLNLEVTEEYLIYKSRKHLFIVAVVVVLYYVM